MGTPKIPRGGLIREAATLVSGNVLAQAITLVAYFVLTRIYPPEDYGLFNIVYSYIEVFIIFSTCKYELAIVVADDEREAAAVTRFGNFAPSAQRATSAKCGALLPVSAVPHLLNQCQL